MKYETMLSKYYIKSNKAVSKNLFNKYDNA